MDEVGTLRAWIEVTGFWEEALRVVMEGLAVGRGVATVLLLHALFLCAGTLFRAWSRRVRDDALSRQRWRSVLTWWMLTGAFVGILRLGPEGAAASMALLSLLLVWEALGLLGQRSLFPVGVAVAVGIHLWAWSDGTTLFLVAAPVMLGAWALIELSAAVEGRRRPEGPLSRVRALSRGGFLAVAGPSFVVAVASLPAVPEMPESRMGWFALLVILTELNDSAQAWGGRAFGSSRMAPRLSPRKTWAGLWSGIVVTAASSVFLAPLMTAYGRSVPTGLRVLGLGGAELGGSGSGTGTLWLWSLGLGVVVSVAGVAGDLLESSLKRRAGVKDSGDLLPGHGGLMDRFDSLAVTAPVFFAVTWILWF